MKGDGVRERTNERKERTETDGEDMEGKKERKGGGRSGQGMEE